MTHDPTITAYITECDYALRQHILGGDGTRRLNLPLPQSPTQVRALNHWLEELYRETDANRIHIYFRPTS
jgi:hypothetical protein